MIVANALLRKVQWASSPELERLVLHGTREDHTDAYSVSKDGKAFYNQLRMMGSYQAHSAQQALVTEWSRILCAAYSPDDTVVFNDVSSHESFTSSLLHIMINYERVPAQKAAPPVSFVETILKLIVAEVPKLKTYAEAQILAYSTDPELFGSRNLFFDDVAKRAKWLMPSNAAAHQTSMQTSLVVPTEPPITVSVTALHSSHQERPRQWTGAALQGVLWSQSSLPTVRHQYWAAVGWRHASLRLPHSSGPLLVRRVGLERACLGHTHRLLTCARVCFCARAVSSRG